MAMQPQHSVFTHLTTQLHEIIYDDDLILGTMSAQHHFQTKTQHCNVNLPNTASFQICSIEQI